MTTLIIIIFVGLVLYVSLNKPEDHTKHSRTLALKAILEKANKQ